MINTIRKKTVTQPVNPLKVKISFNTKMMQINSQRKLAKPLFKLIHPTVLKHFLTFDPRSSSLRGGGGGQFSYGLISNSQLALQPIGLFFCELKIQRPRRNTIHGETKSKKSGGGGRGQGGKEEGKKDREDKKKKIGKRTNEGLHTFIFGISILKIESSCFFLWKENGNRGDNENPDKIKTRGNGPIAQDFISMQISLQI